MECKKWLTKTNTSWTEFKEYFSKAVFDNKITQLDTPSPYSTQNHPEYQENVTEDNTPHSSEFSTQQMSLALNNLSMHASQGTSQLSQLIKQNQILINQLQNKPSSTTNAVTTPHNRLPKHRLWTLQSSDPSYMDPHGYCHSHGFRVHNDHNSKHVNINYHNKKMKPLDPTP